jgi:hypothetical protein
LYERSGAKIEAQELPDRTLKKVDRDDFVIDDKFETSRNDLRSKQAQPPMSELGGEKKWRVPCRTLKS